MPVETQINQAEQPPAQQQHQHSATSRTEIDEAPDEQNDDDMDEDAAIIDGAAMPRTGYERVFAMVEKFAATRMGQHVIERADRALRTVENTAKWSLPEDKNNEIHLERPMSWIPFLCLIVTLRCVRIALSIAALMIGNGPVTPYDVVYFIQTRRRKLRAIRMQGSKTIKEREAAANSLKSNSTSSGGQTSSGIGSKLRGIFASAICRPGMHREPMRRFYVARETVATSTSDNVASTSTPTAKLPCNEDDNVEEDQNLTVDQMLTKYANASSEDDSDFVPNAHDTTNDDDSASSDTSSESGSGDETEVQNNAHTKIMDTQPREEIENEHGNDASSATNGTNTSADMSYNHNESVEFAGHNTSAHDSKITKKTYIMPKPIIEIKKEYSTSEEKLVSDMSPKENGGDAWQPDVASDNRRNSKVMLEDVKQDEDESATMPKPKIMKMALSNATTTTGSPQQMMMSNASTHQINSWSETEEQKEYEQQSATEHRSYGQDNQKHTHHQNQQYRHQNRYKNRNRR